MESLKTLLNGIKVKFDSIEKYTKQEVNSIKSNYLTREYANKTFQERSKAFSGKWSDLKGKPELAQVAISGKLSDLDGAKNIIVSDFFVQKSELPVNAVWSSITYGDGKFVAVSSDKHIAYSMDGITWINAQVNYAGIYHSVAYGNGRFVALGYGSNTCSYSSNGITWNKSTMPYSRRWDGLCYGDGKFVAISTGTTYASYASYYNGYYNDLSWSDTQLPLSAKWVSIAYGNGTFVAVSSDGHITYSTDGIVWAEAQVTDPLCYRSITYGGDKFIITSNSNKITYSIDGIVWENIQMSSTRDRISITYGGGKFVVMSDYGNIEYSTDGTTWFESKVNNNFEHNWCSITYGDGKFVAVPRGINTACMTYSLVNDDFDCIPKIEESISRYFVKNENLSKVAKSNNYNDLDDAPTPNLSLEFQDYIEYLLPSTMNLRAAVYCDATDSSFVALGEDGTCVYDDPNELDENGNRKLKIFSLPPGDWRAICSIPKRYAYVAIAYDSNKAITFYPNTGAPKEITLPSSRKYTSIIYGNNYYVAVAENSNVAIVMSANNGAWNIREVNLPSLQDWVSIAYGNGTFVAVSNNSNKAAYSTDGTNWTASYLPSIGNWKSVAYGNGKFVAVKADDSTKSCIAYSTDGITWTSVSVPAYRSPFYVIYGNKKFVALENAYNQILYSEDGINWIIKAVASNGLNFNAIAYLNNQYILVGKDSNKILSTNSSIKMGKEDITDKLLAILKERE